MENGRRKKKKKRKRNEKKSLRRARNKKGSAPRPPTKKTAAKKMGGVLGDETVECDMCSMEVRVASCALRVVRGDVLCAACAACDLSRTMRATLHI